MAGSHDRNAVLDIIERQAEQSGIPRDDFLRFAYIETGGQFNANAHNLSSGAKGLFQFMSSTATEFGIAGREFDAAANTEAAAALYARNRNQITSRQAQTGHAFLSGAEHPNGLDMYLAHQQGGGGYASIQRAVATGEFSRSDTRGNILGNISGLDFERVTGRPRASVAGMSDRELATSFTEYWAAKYAAIEIRDRGIVASGPVLGGRERPAPLVDGTLERGERGDEVRALQESLNQLGFRDAHGETLETSSGIYGQGTQAAVRSFQAANAIEQTGRADEATRQALDDQLARPGYERNRAPILEAQTSAGVSWPAPGNARINDADKPREGHGEFATPRSGGRTHGGVDIQGNVGDPIVSFAPGQVTMAAERRGAAGNMIVIKHDDGLESRYFHLDGFSVRKDERVEAGQKIGTMGRSGNTPAQGDTHLHFEILRNGQRIDPLTMLRGGDQLGAGEARPGTSLSGPAQLGASGASVVALQSQLNQLGYRGQNGNPLETRSGVFGQQTDHALRAFQADRGIEVDGVFGRQSREAVAGAMREREASGELLGQVLTEQGSSRTNVHASEDPSARPGVSFVERMFTAVRNGDGSALRQVVDDHLATPHGTEFTRPPQQVEQEQPGRDPAEPSR